MVARVLIACLVLAAGCEKRSKLYCANNPEDLANCEQTDAAAPDLVSCSSGQCPSGYCEPAAQVCVECYENAHCPAGEFCDAPGTFTCRGCISDTDCGGQACLPDGSCGDDSSVVYVDPAGTNNPSCSFATPCQTIAHGLTLVDVTRKYVRLTGDLAESISIPKKLDVEILGEGARLDGVAPTDWVIKVDESIVKIYGLVIHCIDPVDQTGVLAQAAHTTTLEGVEIYGCGRGGCIETKMGYLNVQRSNLHDCATGGIKSDGTARFSITNTFIHHNGVLGGMVGGAKFGNDKAEDRRFEFNTVVANPGGGIECKTPIAAPNNIIAGNGTGLAATVLVDNVIDCDAEQSLVTENLTPLAFRNTSGMGMPPYDYHIDETSTAKDNAPAQSSIVDDFDGEIRPQDVAKDYGADEYRAPTP